MLTTEQKLVRVSLSRQVLEEMERAIAAGVWTVGEKIPPEPELMAHFGVSRNTLREAIQALIHNGVLQARQGDGTYILAANRFDASIQNQLKAAGLRDTLEVRFALERETAKLAAQRATKADIDLITQVLATRQSSAGEDFVENDLAFHQAIAKACHNQIMNDLYHSIADYLKTLIAFFLEVMPPEDAALNQLHERLAAAIASHDTQEAEAIVLQMNISNQHFIEKVIS